MIRDLVGIKSGSRIQTDSTDCLKHRPIDATNADDGTAPHPTEEDDALILRIIVMNRKDGNTGRIGKRTSISL